MNTESAFAWLNDPKHPLTRHRLMAEFQTRFNGEQRTHGLTAALTALPQARDTAWMTETKGLWLIYHLMALAECALTRDAFDAEPAVRRVLATPMDCGCGDAMALRALVMLGWGNEPAVRERLDAYRPTS